MYHEISTSTVQKRVPESHALGGPRHSSLELIEPPPSTQLGQRVGQASLCPVVHCYQISIVDSSLWETIGKWWFYGDSMVISWNLMASSLAMTVT